MRRLISFTRDFLGQRTSLFPALTPHERARRDALDVQIQEAREQLLSYAYVAACLELEAGSSKSQIRRELVKGVSREAAVMGVYFQESLVADVQNAIEDALAGRPPKFPQRIYGA